jgi:hypothetical protein
MRLLVKNLFPFFILLFVVMGCTEAARQESRERAEREQIEQKAEEAREAIVERLNKRFDSRPDCIFKFHASGSNSDRLEISNCSPTKTRIMPELVLTAGDRKELKSLGFDWVETTNWGGAFAFPTGLWRFNEDSTLRFITNK